MCSTRQATYRIQRVALVLRLLAVCVPFAGGQSLEEFQKKGSERQGRNHLTTWNDRAAQIEQVVAQDRHNYCRC